VKLNVSYTVSSNKYRKLSGLMARKAIIKATEELPKLDRKDAYKTVARLVDESGLTKKEIAKCIGKTYRMLHLALTCDLYPGILIDVLECLGYRAWKVEYIDTEIKTPKGEG